MKRIENIVYGHSTLDLVLPDQMPSPLILYFHGGGLEAGDKSDFIHHAEVLASRGIASASANYRMYPTAKFPEYLEDGAEAFAFLKKHTSDYGGFSDYYIGGSSAGGYLSMMLYFDPSYLGKHCINPDDPDGYIFDAGQPTTHFNVLRERGIDTQAVRIDEAAPLFFVDHKIEEPSKTARLLFLVADNDMTCRYEQHQVMLRTMYAYGYSPARVTFKLMSGYSHCGYTGTPVFTDLLSEFIIPNSGR